MATVTRTASARGHPYLYHPYWAAGIVLAVVGIALAFYDYYMIAHCSGFGTACFALSTHAFSDVMLTAGLVLFIIGIGLIGYRDAAATTETETVTQQSMTAPAPAVTPVAPAPVVVNVRPAPESPPSAVVESPGGTTVIPPPPRPPGP